MTTEQMRVALKKAQPTESWAYKVDRMSESQVVAVYLAFKARGKL